MFHTETLARLLASAAVLMSAAPAAAAISITGSVDPADPGDGNLEVVLRVGVGNISNDSPFGAVGVDESSAFQVDRAVVGDGDGFIGDVLITTSGVLEIEESGNSSNPALVVGNDGLGFVTVNLQGRVTILSSTGDMVVGDSVSGIGYVSVDGPFTQLDIGDDLEVAQNGFGRMEITNRAFVRTRNFDGDVAIGVNAGSDGTLIINGLGTLLRVSDDLTVGGAGAGMLRIEEDAVVDVDNRSSAVTTVGTLGQVELSGGTLKATSVVLQGRLGGAGSVDGPVDIASAGSIVATKAGGVLRLQAAVVNRGSMNARGGEIEFQAAVTNADPTVGTPGTIVLDDGTIDFQLPFSNAGTLASSSGVNHVHGSVTNDSGGTIVVGGESHVTFHDAVDTDTGQLVISPRATVLFLEDLTLGSGSSLSIELALQDFESQPGQILHAPSIEIAGTAALGGTISVDLQRNTSPELGDVFQLLQAAGGLTGDFADAELPELAAGLGWDMVIGVNRLAIEVIATAGIPGDFNRDGIVSAADYTVWRDGLGSTFTQADYDVWKVNYGIATGNSSTKNVPVSEPATWLLPMGVLTIGMLRRMAGRRRDIKELAFSPKL